MTKSAIPFFLRDNQPQLLPDGVSAAAETTDRGKHGCSRLLSRQESGLIVMVPDLTLVTAHLCSGCYVTVMTDSNVAVHRICLCRYQCASQRMTC